MRTLVIAASLFIVAGAAAAQDAATPTADAPAVQAPTDAPGVAPAAQPAAPAKGSAQEVVCKRIAGTGSRLGNRARKVCATREAWDDQNSAVNRELNTTISRGTPAPKG